MKILSATSQASFFKTNILFLRRWLSAFENYFEGERSEPVTQTGVEFTLELHPERKLNEWIVIIIDLGTCYILWKFL